MSIVRMGPRSYPVARRPAGPRPIRRGAAMSVVLLAALLSAGPTATAGVSMLHPEDAITPRGDPVPAAVAAPIYGTGIAADSKANMPVGPWPKIAHGFKAVTSSGLKSIRFSQRGGSGYSAGSGGTMKISVQTDNGSGRPSGTILASLTFKPGNPSGGWTTYQRYDFPTPATLTAGRKYYIVFQNLSASPKSNYISINNIAVLGRLTSPRQPAFADADYVVLSTARGSWAVEPAYTAVMDLSFTNGKHNGQSYIEAMLAQYGVISGTQKRVRETFLVSGGDRRVSMVAVRVRRTSGSRPLMVRLESAAGTRIETVAIPASAVPLTSQVSRSGEVWVVARFLTPHVLKNGLRYHLRLSTDQGTQYTMVPIREGTDAGLMSRRFTDGDGQRTTDGVHWSNLYRWSPVDLQFYFR